jgi:hypothetical protein
VLDVYHRPFAPKRPLVCLDEASRPLIGEVVQPLPAAPGQPARFDYEYVRNGTANLFLIFAPLVGWRHVEVTERRTAKDFAEVVRWLVEDVHPDAAQVVALHPEAWQLAEQGGDRVERAGAASAGRAHREPGADGSGDERVGGGPQRAGRGSEVALHHGGCTHQTP